MKRAVAVIVGCLVVGIGLAEAIDQGFGLGFWPGVVLGAIAGFTSVQVAKWILGRQSDRYEEPGPDELEFGRYSSLPVRPFCSVCGARMRRGGSRSHPAWECPHDYDFLGYLTRDPRWGNHDTVYLKKQPRARFDPETGKPL